MSSNVLNYKLILMAFLWASSYPLGRWLSIYEAPETIVASRVFLAFLFLKVIAKIRGEAEIPFTAATIGQFFLLGFFGFCIHNFLMFEALEHTEAGKGAVINGAIPIVIMIFDFIIFRRKISFYAMCGVVLSFFGVVLVVSDGHPLSLLTGVLGLGELLFLIAISGWAMYSIIGRPLLDKYPPVQVTAYACLAGFILIFPASLVNLDSAIQMMSNSAVLLVLAVQGLLTMGLGFFWYYEGVKKLGAVNASMYLNLIPIFGIFLAYVGLRELPTFSILLGAVAIILGVVLVTKGSDMSSNINNNNISS